MNLLTLVLVFGMGIVAGLRALTPLAVISWAASWGWLNLEGTWLAFMGYSAAPYILSLLAVGELLNDKFPKTPSRKAPPSFILRVLIGAIAGLAMTKMSNLGALVGALGAVAGTLGGYEARVGLVKALNCPDLPIALLEDVIAIGGGFLIISRLS
jgi:uncharacterized membrane protein